jgi:anaerobic magnesium-protoporphyrin IX monomethyl ester cyclase
MRILLIYPYFIEERVHAEDIKAVPIGLYSVAAVLKENHHDVEVLNWHDMGKNPNLIEEALRQKKPHVVGFSVLHANRWGAIEIARIAKRLDPKTKIVFGGIGATFLWEHLLSHFSEIDFVVLGEGECAFLNLIGYLERPDSKPPEHVKGLAFRKNGDIVRTEDEDLIEDLDELPIPAKYFEYQHVSSSRGCAWQCRFCGSPLFWRKKIRFRSPEHFVDELEMLYKKGVTFFYFSDDTFTMKKKRVIEICQAIIKRGLQITWYAVSRVNILDENVLLWMRKAGCIQISYGIESGSEKIRRVLGKHIETDQIKKAFALTTKYGILSRAYFIYGAPGETWETIQETIDLIHVIKPLSVVFYILDLFPGTELYRELEKESGLTDDIWLNKIEGVMYFETVPDLEDEIILAFGRKLRTAFYENVHAFANAVHLVNRKELYGFHADFFSRLSMTFSHGDYSKIDAVKEKEKTAERLYRKALSYCPNHRAYLGLGIINQKRGENEESVKILSEGTRFFPDSEALNICLGISYMNLGDYQRALSRFSKFPDSREVKEFIIQCSKALEGATEVK